jgi:hypothetical protein
MHHLYIQLIMIIVGVVITGCVVRHLDKRDKRKDKH